MEKRELHAGPTIIKEAVDFVEEQLLTAGIKEESKTAIILAVVEAIGNLMRHDPHAATAKIALSVSFTSDFVVVDLTDDGPGFAFKRRKMPQLLVEDGRGIPIMLALCDVVSYERRQNQNCLSLCKQVPDLEIVRWSPSLAYSALSAAGANPGSNGRKKYADSSRPGKSR